MLGSANKLSNDTGAVKAELAKEQYCKNLSFLAGSGAFLIETCVD